jgi:hypothetical protein
MLTEEYSDEDEKQNPSPMSEAITEKKINKEEKEKCNCSEGCSKGCCSCFKLGSGCHSSCGCGSSCENMFNHLKYFFGENCNYSAHPCFVKWLSKKAKNADELKTMDRFALYRRIKRSPK